MSRARKLRRLRAPSNDDDGHGRQQSSSTSVERVSWDDLPWRAVEELGDLGEFEDAVFYSLEELDGNAIAAGVKRVEVAPSKEEDASTSESSMKKSIKAKRKRAVVSRSEANAPLSVDSALPVAAVFAEWSGIRFRTEVVCALERLGFSEPTPVQAKTIPAILRGGTDVVAAAETGSGKTLAFALPILDRLLLDWEACGASHCPFAIVLSPTRELAMQITSVFKDLCLGLGDTHDVSVVAVVGGMSVQKQRRLLFDIPRNRSAHVVVATPGRLCDMCEDAAAPSLSNLSRVRFLVVDEADRMVEDGHFPEVTKVLHRIRDHEGGSEWEAPRQTLLFSATLNYARDEAKAKRKVKGVSATARALPLQVQELLAVVAVGRTLEVFDLGSRREAAIVSTEADAAASSVKPAAARAFAESSPLSQLPKTLTQLEVRVPAEDKDLALYHYLVTHAGRTLVFVNSIKVARRVDALLRELGVNSRVIHAQMQQRQRLRALDAFKAAPIGVLVATDVAARGLDVQRVQHVIHFDIARSPQTYVHRSGRTARASNVGVALSIVSPMDADSHSAVCRALHVSSLQSFRMDIAGLSAMHERVRIAKDIVKRTAKEAQSGQEESWLQELSRDTGLDLDDYLLNEGGPAGDRLEEQRGRKKGLDKERAKIRALLQSAPDPRSRNGSQAAGPQRRKGSFIVVAK